MLLACAMLFSSVELTAFATEPGMETLQPGDESGTTGENEVTEEEDGTEDSDTEEDVDGTGGSEDDGTGEQTPEDEIDTGKEPGNPEQEDDAADGEEAEGEDQESNDPDKEDPSESDQTEDSDGTVEEEEDSDVTDGNDENEEDGSTDDSGKTEEDDIVSENSVSENSISENSISENSLITVNATNSFGRYFAENISESVSSEESENTGCNVYEIALNGKEASVSFQTSKRGVLVVGIYEENSDRLAASGSVEVMPGDTEVMVPIEGDMPSYFVLRGFLVETESKRPLGRAYESVDYTHKMQEFYSKTTADFAVEQVLNLDENTHDNFMVFSKDVKVIRKSEESGANKVIECDEENRSYKIANPDESITSLVKGDVIAYYYDDNALIITKIYDMTTGMEGDETVLSILGEDVDFDTVIEFIKVGAGHSDIAAQSAYKTHVEPWKLPDWSLKENNDVSLELTDIGGVATLQIFRDTWLRIERTEAEISYEATVALSAKWIYDGKWESRKCQPVFRESLSVVCLR